jgi:hypothetical protein
VSSSAMTREVGPYPRGLWVTLAMLVLLCVSLGALLLRRDRGLPRPDEPQFELDEPPPST